MEPGRDPQRLSRMTRCTGPLVALMVIAVTGCSSSGQDSGASPSPSARVSFSKAATPEGTGLGTVSGRLLLVGGPAPGFRTTSGTVKLHGARSTQGAVDRRGHFVVAVDPGTYRVTGTSPDYGNGRYLCQAAHSVVVVAAETRHVNVFCQLR